LQVHPVSHRILHPAHVLGGQVGLALQVCLRDLL
jgi:hypothetical protein